MGSRRLGPPQSSPEPGAAVLQSPLLVVAASWGVLGAAGWPWGHVAGKRRRETQSVGLLGPKQPSSPVAPLAGKPSTHPVPLSAKCFVPLFVSCRPSSWAPSWSRVPPPIIPMIPWMVLALAHLRRQRERAYPQYLGLATCRGLPSQRGFESACPTTCGQSSPCSAEDTLVAKPCQSKLPKSLSRMPHGKKSATFSSSGPSRPRPLSCSPESDLSIDFVSSGPALLSYFRHQKSPLPGTVHENP